jgi:mRNA-degrading endonuclease YafQ of YafQ-DinJ toxin-antitoxin module
MTTTERKRTVERTSKFRRDVRRSHKQGKDLALLEYVIDLLDIGIRKNQRQKAHSKPCTSRLTQRAKLLI